MGLDGLAQGPDVVGYVFARIASLSRVGGDSDPLNGCLWSC